MKKHAAVSLSPTPARAAAKAGYPTGTAAEASAPSTAAAKAGFPTKTAAEASPPTATGPCDKHAAGSASTAASGDAAVATEKPSNSTHSTMLRKQRTLVTDRSELDMMVVEYSCHDSSVLTSLGAHSKEARWKVQVAYDATPVDIKLHVDKGVVSGPAVDVTCNGEKIFHAASGYTRKAMYDDFEYQWPFRGTVRGVNEEDMFELRPHASAAADVWYPTKITSQHENGTFECVVMMPNSWSGSEPMVFPAVEKGDLREVGTHNPVKPPERFMKLQIPRDDPWHACLSLENKDLVTHHFAWPSPTPAPDGRAHSNLQLHVSKDRKLVTGERGHAVLAHWATGEVQFVTSVNERLKHSWTIQVGPFAKHTVAVEKKWSLSKIVSLTIDGHPFVEATAEDIDYHGKGWQCKFRFVGERVIDFDVYESNRHGYALDSKANVSQKRKYVHDCCVTIPDDMDMREAVFTVDGNEAKNLALRPYSNEKDTISISPHAMQQTYGILVPYKVNYKAPTSMEAAIKTVRKQKNVCC